MKRLDLPLKIPPNKAKIETCFHEHLIREINETVSEIFFPLVNMTSFMW